jgi:NDP-sugar pyrophosphorylase family protein
MLSYILQWLERAGIKDVLVIAPQESEAALNNYLTKVYESHAMRIESVVASGIYGTCDALRVAKDKIKVRFL